MVVAMAKKNPDKAKPGPKPDPANAMSVHLIVRCRPAWKGWAERYAVHRGSSVAVLVDEALLRLARIEGFEMPPER